MPKPRNAGGYLHNLPDRLVPHVVTTHAQTLRAADRLMAHRAAHPPALAGPAPDLERILCATCHVRDTWVPIGSVEAYMCPRCTLILSSKASADPVQWTKDMDATVRAAGRAAARARHRAKLKATRTEARRTKGKRL